MAHTGFDSIPADLLAQVGGGTRMATGGGSDQTMTNEIMQMMQTVSSSIAQLGQSNNSGSSSMSMMLPMMMMMKH